MTTSGIIEKVDALKAELDALRPIDPAIERRLRDMFRLLWTYHSNHLEGNTLSYGETKNLILHNQASGNYQDIKEVKGHYALLKEIEEETDKISLLSERTIRAYHSKMLGGEPYRIPARTPDGYETFREVIPGKYKTQPNHVQTITGEMFYFAEPFETPAKMEELIRWVNDNLRSNSLHPIALASEFHFRFVRIHPFDDGNGRMARILMNIILEIYGYPPAIIRTDRKDDYFIALRKADAGDLNSFVDYIGEQVLQSVQITIDAVRNKQLDIEGRLL